MADIPAPATTAAGVPLPTAGATPPPATSPPAPPPAQVESLAAQVLDLLESINGPTGKAVKILVKWGGVRVVHALLIYPLWIAFLVGLWLTLWAQIPLTYSKTARDAYVNLIQQGFSVGEVAESTSRRDNSLIDYVQTVDFDLTPKLVQRTVKLAIEPNRLVKLAVDLEEGTTKCSSSEVEIGGKKVEPGLSIFAVSQRVHVGTVIFRGGPKAERFSLDQQWWSDNKRFFEQNNDRPIALVLRRTDDGRATACPNVRGTLEVRVFKTYTEPLRATPAVTAVASGG